MIAHLSLILLNQLRLFAPIDHPGADAQAADRVRAACHSTASDYPEALRQLEIRIADSVRFGTPSSATWTHLGCTRALLSLTDVIAVEGPLMISGTSWAQGSINALLRSLTQTPGDPHTGDVLALIALTQAQPVPLADITAALHAVIQGGHASPAVDRACAEFEIRTGDNDRATACANAGLAAGWDSTWHLIRLARISFRQADTISGVNQFSTAAGTARDSLSRADIDWHLQWFLSPDERQQWIAIADSSRAAWVRDRLAARDVRDGQPPGARLAEHFARLEYVEKRFVLATGKKANAGLRTAPATILVPMDRITSDRNGDPIARRADPYDPNDTIAGNTMALPFRDYKRWQVDFDDRGVVWMRFGPPEKRIPWTGPPPEGNVREAWLYEIDGDRMILDFEREAFSGSIEATRLVSGVLGDYLCDIDAWRCQLTMRAEVGVNPVPRETLERLREQDREYIDVATTKDDNSVRGEKNLHVAAHLNRLWDPSTGTPIAVVTYAIRVGDMSIQKNGTAQSAVVDLVLRQWDGSVQRPMENSLSRHLRFTEQKPPDAVETGYLVVPSTPSVNAWSLVASQPDQRLGRAWEDARPPLDSGPLVISDLVLGVSEQGLDWELPSGRVVLAPLNALKREQSLHLYFQLQSAAAHPTVQTTIALYRTDRTAVPDSIAALQMGFSSAVHQGLNEVEHQIDVSRLEAGNYRLEVRVADPSGKLQTKQTTALVIK